MMAYGLTFIAGILTALSPCVLPVLPLIAGNSIQQNKLAPFALALGMISTFVLMGTVLVSLGPMLGINDEYMRSSGAILMILLGSLMLMPRLSYVFQQKFAFVSNTGNRVLAGVNGNGISSSFIIGALLGIIWSPCVGPVLGAALGLASQGAVLEAAGQMAIYGLGASLPLILLVYGARNIFLKYRQRLQAVEGFSKPMLGLLVCTIGVFVLTGVDKRVETLVLSYLPSSFIDLITRF